jgi:hypothetical protein
MKNFIILMLLAAVFSSCVKDMYTGQYFLPGIGGSSIYGGDSWVDPVAIQLGVEAVMSKKNNSEIRGGLGFSYQGAGYKEPTVSGRVRLAYLNVPLIYSYEFKNKIYGEIGLQPGLLLSAKDKYNGGSYDYKDYVNKFELGLPIGAGYRLNDKLKLGARATYGLTKLDAGSGNDHNIMLVGILSYSLNLLKKK